VIGETASTTEKHLFVVLFIGGFGMQKTVFDNPLNAYELPFPITLP
jgi:hypothetical protein